MRKKIKYTISILIGLSLISTLLFGWPIINLYNDFLSAKFLSSLENITPPSNSKIINSFKQFGILKGNSNHCDCEIAVTLESDMNVEEFENYANSLSLDAPFSDYGRHYSEIYHFKKQRLFRIYNGDEIELVHDNKHFSYTIKESLEFYIEKNQYRTLRNIIENTIQKKNEKLFHNNCF